MKKIEIEYEKPINKKIEILKKYIDKTNMEKPKKKINKREKSSKSLKSNKTKSLKLKDNKSQEIIENKKSLSLEFRKTKFEEDYKLLKKMRITQEAPIDKYGASQCTKPNIDFPTYKFQTLVSLILSAQTKDEITYLTTQKLIEYGLTIENMIKIPIEKLTEIIYKVGFHNNKSKAIKKLSEVLREKYNDNPPENFKDILNLPGIGRKMGLLYMKECLNKIEGIAVDTHIHKIANRLGWVNNTKNPEKTEFELEKIVEKKYWNDINLILVGFGQEICKSFHPLCDKKCLLKNNCPYYLNNISCDKGKKRKNFMKRKSE